MKIRTHITIEKDILGKSREQAKRLGLSMSSYVRLIMVERLHWYNGNGLVSNPATFSFWRNRAQPSGLPGQ